MSAREIESIAELDRHLAAGRPLSGLRLQDLDLQLRESVLLQHSDFRGTVVFGGHLTPALDTHLRRHGAVLFPTDPDTQVDPYRSSLYTAEELYDTLGEGYASTQDARAYRWSLDARSRRDAYATLLRAIHDDSISDALAEATSGRRLVGVMGGHAVQRGTDAYAEAARLGARLAAAGVVVVTGGGPGAMEAANLGAVAGDRLESALTELAEVPRFLPDIDAWARSAMAVRTMLPGSDHLRSLGIPTWFYGHEPPNLFADRIAKYFSNALREDVLLSLCTAGIVVLPGTAGTVQEIFQASTRLYYASEPGPPLVLVGRKQWQNVLPVRAVLDALARDRPMASSVRVVDSVDAALVALNLA